MLVFVQPAPPPPRVSAFSCDLNQVGRPWVCGPMPAPQLKERPGIHCFGAQVSPGTRSSPLLFLILSLWGFLQGSQLFFRFLPLSLSLSPICLKADSATDVLASVFSSGNRVRVECGGSEGPSQLSPSLPRLWHALFHLPPLFAPCLFITAISLFASDSLSLSASSSYDFISISEHLLPTLIFLS